MNVTALGSLTHAVYSVHLAHKEFTLPELGGFGPLSHMEAYQKLKQIFNGLTRAHGVFYRGETKESGKVGGKAYILKEEVTDKEEVPEFIEKKIKSA